VQPLYFSVTFSSLQTSNTPPCIEHVFCTADHLEMKYAYNLDLGDTDFRRLLYLGYNLVQCRSLHSEQSLSITFLGYPCLSLTHRSIRWLMYKYSFVRQQNQRRSSHSAFLIDFIPVSLAFLPIFLDPNGANEGANRPNLHDYSHTFSSTPHALFFWRINWNNALLARHIVPTRFLPFVWHLIVFIAKYGSYLVIKIDRPHNPKAFINKDS